MAETRLLCTLPRDCKALNELDENSRIAVSVLMDDGWSIFRVGVHGEVTLTAVPYLTTDQYAVREAGIAEREAALDRHKTEMEAIEERVNRMRGRHRNRVNSFFGTIVYLGLLLAAKLAVDLWNGSGMWASEAIVLAWLLVTDALLYVTQLRRR